MIHSFMRSDFVVADGRRIEASMWICDDVVQLKATIAGADGTLRAEYPSLRRRYRYDPVTIAATIDTFAGEFEALADIAVPWTLLAPVLDDARPAARQPPVRDDPWAAGRRDEWGTRKLHLK